MKKKNQFRKKRTILTIVAIAIIAIVYYQIDYKRYFIGNNDNTEFITIWQRIGNDCYIVPGKYYWIFAPKENFIKTVNYRNYIGIVWNTEDKYSYKLSIYNDYKVKDLETNIDVYSSNDSLLLEYQILESLDRQRGKRIRNPKADSLKRVCDYNYIDLNRIYGIKVYKFKE